MPDFSSLDFFTLVGSLAGGSVFVAIVSCFVYFSLRSNSIRDESVKQQTVTHREWFPGGPGTLALIFVALSLPVGYGISNSTMRFFWSATEPSTTPSRRITEYPDYRNWILHTPDETTLRNLIAEQSSLREEVAFSIPARIDLYQLSGRARLLGMAMVNFFAASFSLLWFVPVLPGIKRRDHLAIRRYAWGVAAFAWGLVYYFYWELPDFLRPGILYDVAPRLALLLAINAILTGVIWFTAPRTSITTRRLIAAATACLVLSAFFGHEAIEEWQRFSRQTDVRILFNRSESGQILLDSPQRDSALESVK